ncbi:MAG TPA: cytochrome c [Polyangiaceae bacterium]
MNQTVKTALKAVIGVLGLGLIGGSCFVGYNVHAFNSSLDKVYPVPVPTFARSADPLAVERGRHLAQSIAPCTDASCHGADLAGGATVVMGPLGHFSGPNISASGLGAAYSDGELFRVIRHGLKKDGRSVRLMPAHEFGWLPDADIIAIVSYLRTLPGVAKQNGSTEFGVLAKVLDRREMIPVDVARRIDHEHVELGPAPTPTADYGRFIGKLCTGCHGEHLSGGPIPGAPPDFAVPLNLTPDESGLKASFEDFDRLLSTGVRKNGKPIDPLMPVSSYKNFDETERRALWAFLGSLPARTFGGR